MKLFLLVLKQVKNYLVLLVTLMISRKNMRISAKRLTILVFIRVI